MVTLITKEEAKERADRLRPASKISKGAEMLYSVSDYIHSGQIPLYVTSRNGQLMLDIIEAYNFIMQPNKTPAHEYDALSDPTLVLPANEVQPYLNSDYQQLNPPVWRRNHKGAFCVLVSCVHGERLLPKDTRLVVTNNSGKVQAVKITGLGGFQKKGVLYKVRYTKTTEQDIELAEARGRHLPSLGSSSADQSAEIDLDDLDEALGIG